MSLTILRVLAGLMRSRMALTWAERAQAELGASRRFRELSVQLRRVGAHPQILSLVDRAEREEDDHALQCSKMALKLGHATGFARLEPAPASTSCSWATLSADRDRVLLDVVSLSCITESLNASLLNTIYAHSRHNEPGRLIRRILKDEVRHAQIGWAYLSEETRHRDCSFVATYLSEMLDLSVRDELFLPAQDDSGDASFEYGVMPMHLRMDQFCDTLNQVVRPGFEHFGIDTSAIVEWLSTQANATP